MTSGSTEVEVASAADFPAVPFYIVIDPYSDSSREYILVGAKAGTTFSSLSRNLTGSQSQDHSIGDVVRSSYTAQTLEDLWDTIDALPVTHATLPDLTTDDHHNEAHTVASHSDTTATGAELDELTDGSETTLHSHAGGGGGAVDSVFGRTGVVVATLNDYPASLVDNDSTVTGATVENALDFLKGAATANPYFVPNTGFDMRSDLQTALNDAESDGGGKVTGDRGINIIGSASGLTDAKGHKIGLEIRPKVWLEFQGCGNGRSGGEGTLGQNAPSELRNDYTPSLGGGQEYHLVSASTPTSSPNWDGGGLFGVHLDDDVGACDALFGVTGHNGFMMAYVSMAKNEKAGSYCMVVRTAGNGQPTQYGRANNCNIWANNGGVAIYGNNPDWIFSDFQVQHEGGGDPVAGSYGWYIDSNKITIDGGEGQFFDTIVYLDLTNGRGRHFILNSYHLEGSQFAATGEATSMIKVAAGGSLQNAYPRILDCEVANASKYSDPFDVDTNCNALLMRDMLVREQRYVSSTADSLFTGIGTNTVVRGG
jgi:hypothetical protein